MTKAELISRMAEEANITKKATEGVLKSIIGAISQTLKENGEIRIDRIGTFRLGERKARTGVNPRTGAKMDIPASRAPSFRAAKALKDIFKEVSK